MDMRIATTKDTRGYRNVPVEDTNGSTGATGINPAQIGTNAIKADNGVMQVHPRASYVPTTSQPRPDVIVTEGTLISAVLEECGTTTRFSNDCNSDVGTPFYAKIPSQPHSQVSSHDHDSHRKHLLLESQHEPPCVYSSHPVQAAVDTINRINRDNECAVVSPRVIHVTTETAGDRDVIIKGVQNLVIRGLRVRDRVSNSGLRARLGLKGVANLAIPLT